MRGDAHYYLVQNIVASLIFKNAKSNTYRTTTLPAVLYGVIWSLAFNETPAAKELMLYNCWMPDSLTLAFILQCCTVLICMMRYEYEGI